MTISAPARDLVQVPVRWDSSVAKLIAGVMRTESRSPITSEIILTMACNQRCGHCRYEHSVSTPMSFERFTQTIGWLEDLGVRGHILTGGGEPLLNHSFELMTGFLERRGSVYGVNTNLSVLRRMHPQWLKVSLDSASAPDYITRRGVDAFEAVMANVRTFRRRSPETTLTLQCIVNRPGDVSSFMRAHQSEDVDHFHFRPLESRTVNYESSSVDEILLEVASWTAIDARAAASEKWALVGRPVAPCHARWSVITVGSDGHIWHCIHKPNETVGTVMDPHIMTAKANHLTDVSSCESPCRLSVANTFLEGCECASASSFV